LQFSFLAVQPQFNRGDLMAAASPIAAPAVRRLALLYGTLTQLELNNYLEVVSDTEERKQEIKRLWSAATAAFQELPAAEAGLPESIETRPLAGKWDEYLAGIRRNPAFARTFANFQISFAEVEIDKLIAGQRVVHLHWVQKIKEKGIPENLPAFCLEPGRDSTPITIARTANTAFTASSNNPNMRFLGVHEKTYDGNVLGHHPGGQPVHAITLLLGYGISTVNVYRVGRRLILGNGFHRLYALRALGVTHAPVVVQDVTHPKLEMPATVGDVPIERLIDTVRPAVLKDFFDQRLICEITQKPFIKTMQVAWGTNEAFVPFPD
jgi:hypothetical protein